MSRSRRAQTAAHGAALLPPLIGPPGAMASIMRWVELDKRQGNQQPVDWPPGADGVGNDLSQDGRRQALAESDIRNQLVRQGVGPAAGGRRPSCLVVSSMQRQELDRAPGAANRTDGTAGNRPKLDSRTGRRMQAVGEAARHDRASPLCRGGRRPRA